MSDLKTVTGSKSIMETVTTKDGTLEVNTKFIEAMEIFVLQEGDGTYSCTHLTTDQLRAVYYFFLEGRLGLTREENLDLLISADSLGPPSRKFLLPILLKLASDAYKRRCAL